jgi:hypothetical protein
MIPSIRRCLESGVWLDTSRDCMTIETSRQTPGAKATPRERLLSAASDTLNRIAFGGTMHKPDLKMELLNYVPVYRAPAATGGGRAFGPWT